MLFGTGRVGRQTPTGGVGVTAALDIPFIGVSNVLDARLTFTRASVATDGLYTDAAGSSYNSFAIDVPRMSANGLLVEDTKTNYLLNSDAPVTQTTGSLPTGQIYCLWVIGTGSATITAGSATLSAGAGGVATAGVPKFITVSGAGTVVVTVAGSLTRFQLEGKPAAVTSAIQIAPTSYIPTAGTIVVRSPDLCSMATGAWYSTTKSTLYAEGMIPQTYASQRWCIASLDDGANTNSFAVLVQPGTSEGRAIDHYTASTIDILATSNRGVVAGVPYKIAASFANGYSALSCNGGQLTLATLPSHWPGAALNRLVIGKTFNTNVWTNSNGYIRRVRYYPTLFSQTELMRMTSQ